MPYTTELSRVPQFTFYQEDIDGELPINVRFFNGTIELEQGNETVKIHPDAVGELFKALKRFMPEALVMLSKS